MINAILIGILGSAHCLGMCGPLILSMPFYKQASNFEALSYQISYHSGRILTYSFLGTIMGFFGESLRLFFIQQWVSIIMGISILLIYFVPVLIKRSNKLSYWWNKNFVTKIRSKLIPPSHQKMTLSSSFSFGFINGLLPCGLVYIALLSSIAQPTIAHSMLFMILFGLGTGPALIILASTKNSIPEKFQQLIRPITPYFIALIACLLIVRGLGLGIPYISPANNAECCHISNE